MPIRDAYGGRLDPGTVGPRKTPSNPTPPNADPPLQLDRFRNGRNPDVSDANALAMAANACVIYRTRQIFVGARTMANSGTASAGSGDRVRWRWAFRSAPYCHAIAAQAILGPPTADHSFNTRTRIDVYSDASESTLVTSKEMVYGAGPTGSTDAAGYAYLKTATPLIEVSPNTTYYCRAVDVDSGLIMALSVFELASLTEQNSGYVSANNSVMTPIVDTTRENLVSISNNLLQYASATVLTWSVGDGTDPLSSTSATAVNILDGTSMSVSDSTPGWTIDLTNTDRLSQSAGIPCQVRVFGSWTKGASVNDEGGTILIKDSGGNTLASITDGWSSATPIWVSTTVTLPASEDKIDILFNSDSGGGEFKLYAISIWPQG